jgi:tetratricopeptide (TPR) repeat protein
MKQAQRAIAIFEEALRIMPGYAPALTGLAEAYEAIGNLERAESILQSVTNRSSGVDVSTYMVLARVQRKLGKFDAAAQSYSKISQFPGHERDAILGLADLFREKGDKERALQLLEQARPYFPENDPSLEEMIRSIRNSR